MKAELKEKYIAELTSGKYVQLKKEWKDDNNGRCALTILYELMGIPFKKATGFWHGRWTPDVWEEDNKTQFGILVSNPSYREDIIEAQIASGVTMGEANRILKMNESGKTFAEIAEWVKAN